MKSNPNATVAGGSTGLAVLIVWAATRPLRLDPHRQEGAATGVSSLLWCSPLAGTGSRVSSAVSGVAPGSDLPVAGEDDEDHIVFLRRCH
jgi:hypothetical protein